MERPVDVYELAMALTPGMSLEIMRRWHEGGHTPEEFFRRPVAEVAALIGASGRRFVGEDDRRHGFAHARTELEFINRYGIRTLFPTDDEYPVRLKESPDAPLVLFMKGEGNVSTERMVSVVGTRKPTEYGVRMCRRFVADITSTGVETTIVSGLAYGVDACAHTSALEAGAPTIAVVAHGLDMVYPAAHRQLAGMIVHSKGLIISEYPSKEKPQRHRFLERNRIVAALSDATVVIESGYRGGALSTANIAFNLSREVFALPGRVGDEMSEGCNKIISREKARLLLGSEYFLDSMGWEKTAEHPASVQRSIFPELDPAQRPVYELLKRSAEPLPFDVICNACRMNVSQMMSMLSEMEFDGTIVRHPGNRFSIN